MITNKHNLDLIFYNWLAPKPREPIKNRISVTDLGKPIKELLLARKHWNELDKDVMDFYWAKIGQAIHSSLENVEIPDAQKELKFEIKIDEITLVGIIDLIIDKTLYDYKTTHTEKIVKLYDKKKWLEQLSIYRWIYFKKYGIKLKDKGIIYGMLLDWKIKDHIFDYPIQKIQLNLWSFQRTELFIQSKISKIREASHSKSVPTCQGEENWYGRRCAWCPVKKFCDNWKEVK